jgi:lysophospholipase L1-like esterase
MAKTQRNSKNRKSFREIDLKRMQYGYILGGLFLLPVSPFLYAQGQYTRWKVGRLPDAGGASEGTVGDGNETIRLLAIGESTVAGIGAKTHEDALTGQFAKHLGTKKRATVNWIALGKSGITVKRTLKELVPRIPEKEFDVVVVALGGNDVFTLNSPEGFRNDMIELLWIIKKHSPSAKIFLANVPMVRDFVALPNPLRYVLSRLAKLHHFNAIDLVSEMSDVFYFDDVNRVDDDFFSDGIHPSRRGYDLWSEAMVNLFIEKSGY